MNAIESMVPSSVSDWQALDGCPNSTCGQTCVGPSSAIDPLSIAISSDTAGVDALGQWR
jgi:hypothetical protein